MGRRPPHGCRRGVTGRRMHCSAFSKITIQQNHNNEHYTKASLPATLNQTAGWGKCSDAPVTGSTRTAYAASAINPGKSSLAAKRYSWHSILEQLARGLRDDEMSHLPTGR